MRSMEAPACMLAFTSTWVARFGVPAVITSDQGAQFTSSLWETACDTWGCQHITTSPVHPQSNGMVERTHRQLKDALRARLAGVEWLQHLPWVLLGLRAAAKESSGVSSAELVYGCSPTLPGEFLAAGEKAPGLFTQRLNSTPAVPTRRRTYAEAACTPSAALLTASHVYVRRGGILPPLEPRYAGPYAVVQPGTKCFVLQVGSRRETVSVDRLKPHLGAAEVAPASPPRRGRPPRR